MGISDHFGEQKLFSSDCFITKNKEAQQMLQFAEKVFKNEACTCIGDLVIQNICHFTSRDIGYFPFYFQGYRILCLIFSLLPGILNILEN